VGVPRRRSPPGVRLRRATLADLPLLVRHRGGMFRAMGGRSPRTIAAHLPVYERWLVPRLASAEAVAWIADDEAGRPLGSATLWFQPGRPRPGLPSLRVPYLLSVFTEPAARGRGVATAIVLEAATLSKRLGYTRLELHASRMGRRVYERLGFEPTTEMRWVLDPAERRRERRRHAAEAARDARAATTKPARRARA
jgi:GNAT superfamily N-acetyltransferase